MKPMSASSTWQIADEAIPANGSARHLLSRVAKYAYLAPTQTEWHPWEILLHDSHLDLVLKDEQEPQGEDADLRYLMIRCGVALQYLKVAMKHLGRLGRVELFPDLDRRSLVARMHCGYCREQDAHETSLFNAITSNRDQRSFTLDYPVPDDTRAALSRVVVVDRAWLEWTQSDASRQRVLEFTLANDVSRRFSAQALTLGVIKTKTDDERGWLAAGQAVALAILQAQAWGIGWSFFHRIPDPGAREALRMGVGQKGFAQFVLRFGGLLSPQAIQLASATSTVTFR